MGEYTEGYAVALARARMAEYDIDPDVYFGMFGSYGYWLDDAREEIVRAQFESECG